MQANVLFRTLSAAAICFVTLFSLINPVQADPLPDNPQPNLQEGTKLYLPVMMYPPPPAWHEVSTGSDSGRGITQSGSSASNPTIVVARDGTPYVTWEDGNSSNREIYVKRWDGKNWIEVGSGSASGGGISNTSSSSLYPRLAIAPDNTPYVCWTENVSNDMDIFVRRWNGSNWVEVGSDSASGGGISNNIGASYYPSIAIAPDGTPYVAWEDDTNGKSEIYVKRWNGSNWVEVGTNSAKSTGISRTSVGAVRPVIAIASDGAPYVAWQEGSSYPTRPEIFVRRFDGDTWVEVGSGSASGGGISRTSSASSYGPSIAIASNNAVYVSWYEEANSNTEIYLRYWNGSSWLELGSGSASGGGISKNNGSSDGPAVAVSPDGKPYIAWYDGTSGNVEIYARYWNSSSWAEVGTGSASGGGISTNSGDSRFASISIAPNGIPFLAWQDTTSGHLEIYVKYFGY